MDKFNTLENKMITGGAPNNPLTMLKFKNALNEKNSNPFKTIEREYFDTSKLCDVHLGPGTYNI